MKKQTRSLIVGPPGPLRDSMALLLKSIFPEGITLTAENPAAAATALKWCRPVLVLWLSQGSVFAWKPALEEVRSAGSSGRFVVLAENETEAQAALDGGADRALLKGCPATDLMESIERAVSGRVSATDRGDESPPPIRKTVETTLSTTSRQTIKNGRKK
jgi:DNA-binding NarL/FixJ family response regulator